MIEYPATKIEPPSSSSSCPSMGEMVTRGSRQVQGMIEDRPTRSLFCACLAGIGLGLCIGRALARPADERGSGRAFDRRAAENFGHQVLARVERAMPEMVRERLFK